MLAEAPYEFSWYNLWLQKSQVIPIEVREPLVKTFHHEGQHLEYALRGIGPDDIARGFVGVVVNSNYARSWADSAVGEAPEETLARYVPSTRVPRRRHWRLKVRDHCQSDGLRG